jgi:glutaminase
LSKFAALNSVDLQTWIQPAQARSIEGKVADRIPQLAQADANEFALCIDSSDQQFVWGEADHHFVLMSVIKPFVLLYLLEQVGAEVVFGWVGTAPSDERFNSLLQLTLDRGYPRNPMINSGAIVLADKLPGADASDRCQRFWHWLNQQANCNLQFDAEMLASVAVGRAPNQAIVRALVAANRLTQPELALETYEQICCLSANVRDLARLGLLLAMPHAAIAPAHRVAVNALMLTCGLYEASAAYGVRMGLPIKSGISGALLATVPGHGAIACYSPALDAIGNPVVGLAFVEAIANALNLSVFS